MQHATQQQPMVKCPLDRFKPCKGLACAWNLGSECAIHSLGYLCAANEAMAQVITQGAQVAVPHQHMEETR